MKQLYKNEKWLRKTYCVKKKTITEIAVISNSSPAQIYRYTKKFNLPRPVEFIGRQNREKFIATLHKKKTFSIKGRIYSPTSFEYRDKNWLIQQYQRNKLTLEQIGSLCGVSGDCVLRWMVHCNIPRRERANKLEHNGRWTGGIVNKAGYRFIKMPSNPSASKNGYIREHRFIMEQTLGRHLTNNEHVHHLDGDKLNNHSSNLRLFTNSEHKIFEQKLQLFIKKILHSSEPRFIVSYRDDLQKRFLTFLSMSK